jgi:hypothetical protein
MPRRITRSLVRPGQPATVSPPEPDLGQRGHVAIAAERVAASIASTFSFFSAR